ncbi:U-box domain-containing protein 9 isoform X2 [Glycine max]|uniref:U-box domain-containing protein 9 isoform X2 n=1 Tax=Glycine max TaxID=3847 RepID=UPI0007193DB1|nr:U-box domain-containing protein 9 isoform X2 [Glycine max]|eukprot:XP_014626677.1 U-box domain-containing protein 9 isoform X2 [Glycine max]
MAKPGVLESDPGVMVKKAIELKRELQRLVKSIVDDEDCSTETIDQAKETLCVLKELKLRKRSSLSLKLQNKSVTSSFPDEFKCPLSKELMRDPVILASGQKMSSTLSDQKTAAKELRLLTKKHPCFRVLFCDSADAIPQLLKPICGSDSFGSVHPDLQEDVITTLLNISIHDNNKKLVAETPMVIPLLMRALRSGTIETRSNAAAALFTLSALDSNKELIGKSGALKPLIDLLEEGHPLAMKDVASAIFNICVMHENKARAVKDGAVRVILAKINKQIHVAELLAILALLSSHQSAVHDMGDLGAVPSLLRIIKESSCERNKENCVAILQTICLYDRSKLKEIREEENGHKTISELAKNGTSRAKRKASGILERLNRVVHITHTA